MAYDPYGTNQLEQSNTPTLGSIASTYLNPVNVLGGIYTSIPSVWDTEKGIWSPINFNQMKEQWTNAFFKDKMSKATKKNAAKVIGKQFSVNWRKIPEAIKNTVSLNPWGGFRVATGNLTKISKIQEKISALDKGILKKDLSSFQQTVKKAESLKNSLKDLEYQGGLGTASKIHLKSELKERVASLNEARKKLRSESAPVRAGFKKRNKLLSELRFRKAGKWAVRGAKAGSIVGWSMLAWDIGTAIATPLLNSSVQLLGNAINSFENRFMPEMGGKLQMSYLSYGAATERQRAIQGMSKAYINGRSAFGSEGAMYHQ